MTDLVPRVTGGQEVQQWTGPTPDQVVTLLQRAAAYDKRTFGHSEKAAWTSASVIGEWTFEEACRAIDFHKATSTDYLEPSHVTQWIRAERRKARVSGGYTEDGTRLPSHAEVLALWVAEMRKAGANPTDEQTARASDLLAQLLDGAPDAVLVLQATIKAARKFSDRIDWALEKIGKEHEKSWTRLTTDYMPPDVPVEFIPLACLTVKYVVEQPDFPDHWRAYDPFGAHAERRAEQRVGMLDQGFDLPPIEPTPRDVPAWIVELREDKRQRDHVGRLLGSDSNDFATPEARADEARAHKERKREADEWLAADRAAWEQERLPLVRQWYLDHPDKRPDSTWWISGPAYEANL